MRYWGQYTLAPYINVVGDWVYYRYSTPVKFTYPSSWDSSIIYEETAYAGSIYKIRTNAQIYKTKFDGSQYTLLYSGPALGNRLNISGDDIYFATSPDKGTYIVKTDGTGLTKISEDSARSLCIAGDYLYYNFYYDSNYFSGPTYRIKLDGTDRTDLSQ